MFFQSNNTSAVKADFSSSMNEVSTQSLQATPAETIKKSWLAIMVLAVIAWALAPKGNSKNKFNRSFKRK